MEDNYNLIPFDKTMKKNGITPSVDGERFDVKRSYQLRYSTVRMLNELKAKHQDVNVYFNNIVDEAIRNYYDYIVIQGHQQK